MAKWDAHAEHAIMADAGRSSFRCFMKYVFGIYRNPEGSWWTEDVHGPWCDWLQEKLEAWEHTRKFGPKKRHYLLINAMRGSGKTLIVTKGANLWLQLRNPETAAVIDSVQQKQSIEFAEVIRKIYENLDPYCWFTWLYGNWYSNETWTKDRFTHAARTVVRTEGSFECSSVETGITGRHPHVHTLDDPVTIEKLREAGNWIQLAKKHVTSIFPALLNDSLFILVATPYTDNDVVMSSIREDGINDSAGLALPKEYKQYVREGGKWDLYFLPARDANGVVTLPAAWPEKELMEYETKSPAEAAAQVHLRPGSGGEQPLDFDSITEMQMDLSHIPKRLPISFHFDTAFKEPQKIARGDDSVIQVWAHMPGTGMVYFLDSRHSNRWNVTEFVENFIQLYQRYHRSHRVLAITDERIIGGKHGIWSEHLRAACQAVGMRLPRFIEISRGNTRKVARHMEAAGYWAGGYVRLANNAAGLNKLIWQMARIGVSDKDDFADCASDVFHPEIYRIFRTEGREAAPLVQRPTDRYLQTGKLSQEALLDFYDQEHGDFQG